MDIRSTQEHYDQHLGPVYSWMTGGVESAIQRGATELADIGVTPSAGGIAVDLGAGFGMHAIPLAHRGFRVIAVDSCEGLLDELKTRMENLTIETINADLLTFGEFLPGRPELVLCMGDTLTHLPDLETVEELISAVSTQLHRDGRFVMTFRDYTVPLTEENRFIHVRSDADRILTCLLEYYDETVKVSDIFHERDGSEWKLNVSSYQKLRLCPAWLLARLQEHGFTVRKDTGPSGMLRFNAEHV